MFALEPGELGKITLQKHEGQDNAPYCLAKAMSMREQREYAKAYDAIFEFKERDDFFENVKRLFSKHVMSFHGYRSEEMEDAFSKEGLIEILRRLLSGQLIAYEEKKS